MRKRKLRRGEDAHQVKLEQVAKFLDRKIVDRFVGRVPSGIVDKTVESPVTRDRGIDQVSNVLSSGNIAEDEFSIARSLRASQVTQIGSHLGALIFIVAADDDFGAGLHKLVGTPLADTAAATGDDCDFVCVTRVSHWRSPRSLYSNIRDFV